MVGAKSMSMTWLLLFLLQNLAMVCVHGAGSNEGAASPTAPAPAMDCTSALLGLADCLSFVQEGSTAAKPTRGCCSGLKEVVKKEVSCLCEAFKGSQNFGVSLNMTKALSLPSACKLKTPPFSKCNIAVPGVAGGAPAPSPGSGGSAGEPSATTTGEPSATTAAGGELSSPSPSPAHSAAVRFSAASHGLIASAAASLLASCFLYI